MPFFIFLHCRRNDNREETTIIRSPVVAPATTGIVQVDPSGFRPDRSAICRKRNGRTPQRIDTCPTTIAVHPSRKRAWRRAVFDSANHSPVPHAESSLIGRRRGLDIEPASSWSPWDCLLPFLLHITPIGQQLRWFQFQQEDVKAWGHPPLSSKTSRINGWG